MAVRALRSFSLTGEICHSPAISWSADNRISLAIDDGIHIFEPIFNENDAVPFNCKRSFIPNSTEALIMDVECSHDSILNSANREVTMRLMLDRTLCYDASNGHKFKGFRGACWSPNSPTKPYKCVLVSMSIDHRVVIHKEVKNRWVEIEDLSKRFYADTIASCFNHCKFEVDASTVSNQQFSILKSKLYFLSAVEMVWTQCFSHTTQDFACLLIAMKSGHIVFWKINLPCETKEDIELILVKDTGLGLITSLIWQPIDENKGMLVIGANNGLIQMLTLEIEPDKVNVNSTMMLWDEEDSMAIKCSAVGLQNGNYVVVCGKSHYIISTLLTSEGSLIRQAVSEGIHTLPLTNICSLLKGWFLACSMDFNIYKFQVDTATDEITLMEEIVNFDVAIKKLMPHGIIQSPNGVFCCLIQRWASSYDHVVHKEPIKLNFFINQEEDEIWENVLTSKKLFSQCKDVQEFIKVRLNFENILPKHVSQVLDADEADLNQESAIMLKLIRFILFRQISHSEDDQKKSQLNCVSKLIMIRHTLSVIEENCSNDVVKMGDNKKCSSLFMMARWLLSDDCKHHLTVEQSSVVEQAYSVLKLELPQAEQEESCSICQESIPFTNIFSDGCCNGHLFARCCLTLLVCDGFNYRRCSGCQALATSQNYWSSDAVCIFCDELIT